MAARRSVPRPYHYNQPFTYLLINLDSCVYPCHYAFYKAIMARPLWAVVHSSYNRGLNVQDKNMHNKLIIVYIKLKNITQW